MSGNDATMNAPAKHTDGKGRLRKIAVLAIVAFSCWLYGLIVFAQDTAWLVPSEDRVETDAIVVLTGGADRIKTGFELLEQGYAEKLFISGVYHGVEVRELLKRREKASDDLECCIVLGHRAENTRGNAIETRDWLAKQGYASARLVTANYHLRRAMLEFRRAAPHIRVIGHPVVPSGRDFTRWWADGRTALLLAREYNKYIAAFLTA